MAKVTIHDISREAQVSIATVSRVLNKKGNVSKEVEARVLEAAKKLNYTFTKAAPAAESAKRPKLIAVLLPGLSNPFYNDILDGIQDVAAKNKYNLIVMQNKIDSMSYDSELPRFLNSNLVDGLITMMYATHLKTLSTLIDPQVPVVQCCEYDEELPYPYVAIDDYQAAYNAVSYLGGIGRKRIAFLNSTSHSQYGRKREQGYRDAMRDLGLPVNENQVYHLNLVDLNVAFSASLKMLSDKNCPDAIFTVSDIYAIAASRAARRLGLRVPQDVAIVGFDNIDMASMNEPPLTTVNQPRYEIGSTCCATLLGIIKKRPPMANGLLLESELVVRSST